MHDNGLHLGTDSARYCTQRHEHLANIGTFSLGCVLGLVMLYRALGDIYVLLFAATFFLMARVFLMNRFFFCKTFLQIFPSELQSDGETFANLELLLQP